MRTIDRPGSFKRDYKREAKDQHRTTLDKDLVPVLKALATDQPLEPRHRDHDLTGARKRVADGRDGDVKHPYKPNGGKFRFPLVVQQNRIAQGDHILCCRSEHDGGRNFPNLAVG